MYSQLSKEERSSGFSYRVRRRIVDRQTDGRTDEQTDKQMNRQTTDRHTHTNHMTYWALLSFR